MKKQIRTEILIHASPQKVWSVLTNFEEYPNWNPFVKTLSGNVKVGNKIKVNLPGMSFTPTVVAFEATKEFRWIGHLLFNGLFDGEHCFQLIDNGNNTTTFIHSENFNGILVGIFSKKLNNETKPGFEEMNRKLKEICDR